MELQILSKKVQQISQVHVLQTPTEILELYKTLKQLIVIATRLTFMYKRVSMLVSKPFRLSSHSTVDQIFLKCESET